MGMCREQGCVDRARAGADVHRRLVTCGTQPRNQNRQRARFVSATRTRARHDDRYPLWPNGHHCRTLSFRYLRVLRFLWQRCGHSPRIEFRIP